MNYFGYPILNPFRSMTPAGFYDPVKGHTGIDISTPENTALSLPVTTKVVMVTNQTEMGHVLYLKDADGNYMVFAHLASTTVFVGQDVQPNQVFAFSGNSGTATTGPHLHFEVIATDPTPGLEMMNRSLAWITGYNIDPVPYLDTILAAHWSQDSMDWAKEHGIISGEHNPDSTVTWGELAVSMQRLATKILEWTRN